jgi:iron-sulfur cluster repair protein YtfE (RIC family)
MAADLPTQPFREEHAELLGHIEELRAMGGEIARVPVEQREVKLAGVLDFLGGTLVPHAQAEEEVLYPEWAKLVGYADAAVPMVHDHEAIVARVDRLAGTSPEDTDALQELLYGLYALITVHFRKEEDIQLPVFDAQPKEVVEGILERMGHGAHGHDHH